MRIALVTGSRADRGALEMVQGALIEAGQRVRWIDLDSELVGHPITRTSTALSEMFCTEQDIAIVHGDRHEILGAVVGLNIEGVPIAHIGGGDLTEGSQDDCFRHAITKLSHMHFATCQKSADRIIQMGEEPDRVHITGDPGIDRVMATKLLSRDETFAAVGLPIPARSLLVSLHPNTLGDTASELKALSEALMSVASGRYFDPSMVMPVDEHLAQQRFGKKDEVALVFIGPNADAGGDLIRKQWKSIVAEMPQWAVYHDNLSGQVYLSLMRWCDAMMGNSSAGFYEAPCFGTPVINIGDRQKGRWAWNVIGPVPADAGQISEAIGVAMKVPRVNGPNPYGDGHSAERIAKIIGGIKDPKELLRKRFNNLPAPMRVVIKETHWSDL